MRQPDTAAVQPQGFATGRDRRRLVEAGDMARRWDAGKLKQLRETLSMSPERLAEVVTEATGVTISGRKVRRWEDGTYAPNVRELEAVCDAFHIDVAHFFSEPLKKKKP